MKIRIFGAPGSGKTHKALALAQEHHLPLLHIDDVLFRHKYNEKRSDTESHALIQEFISTHDQRIIEWATLGSYLPYMQQADQIIHLDTPFLIRLRRMIKRYIQLYGTADAHTLQWIRYMIYDYDALRKNDIAIVSKWSSYKRIK